MSRYITLPVSEPCELEATPAGSLLRVYVDLVETDPCPLHARAVALAWRVFCGEAQPLPVQVRPPRTLRWSLARAAGLPMQWLASPEGLPASRHGDRWRRLLAAIDAFPQASAQQAGHTIGLLTALGFYTQVAELLRSRPAFAVEQEFAQNRMADAEPCSRALEAAALHDGPSIVGLRAATALVVAAARLRSDRSAARRWAREALRHANVLAPDRCLHDAVMWSATLRSLAYVPFLDGDRGGTWELLDEALDYAERRFTDTPAHAPDDEHVRRQNAFALYETRSATARHFGQRARACEMADALVQLDPWDERTHLRRGELRLWTDEPALALDSFITAGALAGPLSPLAWLRVSDALRAMGRGADELTALTLLLRQDPGNLNAEARMLEQLEPDTALGRWLHACHDRKRVAAAARLDAPRTAVAVDARHRHYLSLSAGASALDIGRTPTQLSLPQAHAFAPYFDLSPASPLSPICARIVAALGHQLSDSDAPELPVQGVPPSWLRASLMFQTGLHHYDVHDPRELPESLRTPAWQRLCELLEARSKLPQLASVLVRIGLFDAAVRLLNDARLQACPPPQRAQLRTLRAHALLKLTREPQLSHRELHEAYDEHAGHDSLVGLVVHAGKFQASELPDYEAQLRRDASTLETQPLQLSILLRAWAYLPFHQRDLDEADRLLARAEQAADAALEHDDLPARENLFAVLETRHRVDMARRAHEHALTRAQRWRQLDPFDVRPHVAIGQTLEAVADIEGAIASYQAGARLGGPWAAHAHASLARLLGDRGDRDLALLSAVACTYADPRTITGLLALRRFSASTSPIAYLASRRLARLRSAIPPRGAS